MPVNEFDPDTPYRKKRNQKSKASRRSDHKHVYEKCLFRKSYFKHLCLGKRCVICGKSEEDWLTTLNLTDEEILAKYNDLKVV